MKIKTDFVTNSSSASFLVVIENDVSVEYLSNLFLPSVTKRFIETDRYGIEHSILQTKEEFDDLSEEIQRKSVADVLARKLLNLKKWGIDTETHTSIAGKCGNEDKGLGLLGLFLYECNIPKDDSKKFQIKFTN